MCPRVGAQEPEGRKSPGGRSLPAREEDNPCRTLSGRARDVEPCHAVSQDCFHPVVEPFHHATGGNPLRYGELPPDAPKPGRPRGLVECRLHRVGQAGRKREPEGGGVRADAHHQRQGNDDEHAIVGEAVDEASQRTRKRQRPRQRAIEPVHDQPGHQADPAGNGHSRVLPVPEAGGCQQPEPKAGEAHRIGMNLEANRVRQEQATEGMDDKPVGWHVDRRMAMFIVVCVRARRMLHGAWRYGQAAALGKARCTPLWAASMTSRPDLALLFAGEAGPGDVPPGLQIVAGRTILERQARQAQRAGARAVLVLAPGIGSVAARRFEDMGVRIAADGAMLVAGLEDAREILVIEPGVVLDERLLEAVTARSAGRAIALWETDPPSGARRIDSRRHWASVLKLPGDEAATALLAHPDWEPAETLLRTAAAAGAADVDVAAIPLYSEGRRRDVPILWEKPQSEPSRRLAEDRLLAAAQKGCLDWPARYLHPPLENALVRLLWPTPISPNMVTGLTAVLGLAAGLLILAGQLWWALFLILVVGPLDGVDGKLARTRIEFSRYGDLEHVLDKVMEYGWFAAFSAWFAHQGQGLAAWLVGLGIILFALIEAGQGEWFRRVTGRQLDDWGPFERRVRLVGGRRNTFFWTLVPFAAFGLWWPGFLMILGYAFLTWAVHEWRFLRALTGYLREEAPNVRRNLARTAYAFLPKAGEGSS